MRHPWIADGERPEIMSPYPNSIEIIKDDWNDFELIAGIIIHKPASIYLFINETPSQKSSLSQ